MGGNHPRHLFYLNSINNSFPISGIVVEKRMGGTNNLIPDPPVNISEHDRHNFIKHFENRDKSEKKFFKNQNIPDVPKLEITKEQLNTQSTIDFIESINPDVVLLFGCHFL